MYKLQFRGKAVDDNLSKVCVLFDPKDGRIVHVHGVTTLSKGRSCSKSELEERTISHARAFGNSVSGLKTLHVSLSAIRQRGPLKVDDKGEHLVLSSPGPLSARELFAKHCKDAAKNRR
jgi:hypothetical protein